MTSTPMAPAPAPSKLLYSGPAGKVWTDGVELYGLKAQGVKVQGVMPGGPTNQPTPAEMEAVQSAARNAYGPLKPWMVIAASFVVLVALSLLRTPFWLTLLLGLALTAALVALPIARQFRAFSGMFERREEVTILLSETPTQMVSSMVEIGPDTPAQTLGAARQPVAVVVTGLPLAERVKLAGAVTRRLALGQVRAGRK
ncbi:hypothetical protein [Deinococcus sp.]|uniref:hypothetical protein n=1 Tax=Deinococcus sp. TaxID=47478 RepID=UPI0025C3771D|nr:hypothetical protein [Deinococcus sp.]